MSRATAMNSLIKKFADLSKKNAGEFYTPRSIVKLLIMLLAPQSWRNCVRSSMWNGRMLIEAIRFMHGDNSPMAASTVRRRISQPPQLHE